MSKFLETFVIVWLWSIVALGFSTILAAVAQLWIPFGCFLVGFIVSGGVFLYFNKKG